MATSVGLNFRLTAAVDKFEASMKDVERRLGGIEDSSRKTARGMKLLTTLEIGKSVLSGLTGLFNIVRGGVSTVTQFASQAADAADKIGKLSSATGMAEEPLQVFTQLASYSGVSSNQFGDALQKMSRGLGEAANGTGTAKRALEQMGLSIAGLLAMSPSEQFMAIGSAIGEIEDPAKRSQVAADIFGRSGTKLIPMFENLESNARATAVEMLELGQVLSGSQVDNIEAMNDSFEKVKQTAFMIGTQILANFAPAITEANSSLIEMIKSFEYEGAKGGQGLANFLTRKFFDFAKLLAKALDAFLNGFNTAVEYMLKALAQLIEGLSIALAPFLSFDQETAMYNASQDIERFAKNLGKVDVNLEGLVDTAINKLKPSVNEAANALKGFTGPADDLGGNADFAAEALKGMENAAANATPATDLFGKNVGLSGEQLAQLASDAEKFGPNADLAREALDGMAGAADDATPAAELFGRNVGLSGDALERLALAAEAAQEIDSIEDALWPLRDAGELTGQELETLAALVAQSGGKYGELGSALQDLIRTGENLDRVQQSLTDSMMKPAEDFANQRAEMLRRMGFNPFFVEDQKQKWLAQQRDAVERQVEIQRKAYEKFKDRLGEGVAENIKDAIGDAVDVESTLPELKTQTSTLSDILTAVKEQILQPVLIPG